MIYTIFIGILTGCIIAVAWLRVWRHGRYRDHEKAAAADDALCKLYGRYWAEVRALTQAHLLKAPADEEWLAEIRARISASSSKAPGPGMRSVREWLAGYRKIGHVFGGRSHTYQLVLRRPAADEAARLAGVLNMISLPEPGAIPDFETWFGKFACELRRQAYYFTRDPELAEDIAHDTAVKVFKAWPDEETRGLILTQPGYVRAIVYHCFLDHTKVRSRTNRREAEREIAQHDWSGREIDHDLRRVALGPGGNERDMIILRYYNDPTIIEAGAAQIIREEQEEALRAHIEYETCRGSRKHQRLPRWIRWIPKLVMALDFCLLLYWSAGITNVNWVRPLSGGLALAAILAAMTTVLSFGFVAFAGHRMRAYKDHTGAVHLMDLDAFTRTAAAAAAAAIVAISTLMFTRSRADILHALGAGRGITALAASLSLAVVAAGANYLALAVYAVDGSDETALLAKISAAGRHPRFASNPGAGRPSSRHPAPFRWLLWLMLPAAALGILAVGFYFLPLTSTVVTAIIGAVGAIVAVLLNLAVRREDREFSLRGAAPRAATRGARRLLGFGDGRDSALQPDDANRT